MDGEFDDLMATLGASNTISRSFERAGAVLAPGNPQPAQELHDQAWAAVTIGIDVLDRNEGWDFLTFGGKTEFHARYARLADDGITATDCLLRMMKDGDGADLEEDDGQHLAELAAMSALDLAERLNEHAHAAVYRVLIQHIRSWCDHLTFGPVDMVALRQVAAGLNAVEADRANP